MLQSLVRVRVDMRSVSISFTIVVNHGMRTVHMEGLHGLKRLRHFGILTPVPYIRVESWLSKSELKDLCADA